MLQTHVDRCRQRGVLLHSCDVYDAPRNDARSDAWETSPSSPSLLLSGVLELFHSTAMHSDHFPEVRQAKKIVNLGEQEHDVQFNLQERRLLIGI